MKLLDEAEEAALEKVNAAFNAVLRIDGDELTNARTEVVAAVHVLQGTVIQHALQRIDPENFSAWYLVKRDG